MHNPDYILSQSKVSVCPSVSPSLSGIVSKRLKHIIKLFTRHTLVWQATKFAMSMSALSGYIYLGDGGTDRRDILHDSTYRWRTGLLPFWGQCPRDPQIRNFGPKFWPLDREYLNSGKSQRYKSIRA